MWGKTMLSCFSISRFSVSWVRVVLVCCRWVISGGLEKRCSKLSACFFVIFFHCWELGRKTVWGDAEKIKWAFKKILRGTFSPHADVGFHIMPDIKQHGSFLMFWRVSRRGWRKRYFHWSMAFSDASSDSERTEQKVKAAGEFVINIVLYWIHWHRFSKALYQIWSEDCNNYHQRFHLFSKKFILDTFLPLQ